VFERRRRHQTNRKASLMDVHRQSATPQQRSYLTLFTLLVNEPEASDRFTRAASPRRLRVLRSPDRIEAGGAIGELRSFQLETPHSPEPMAA
jgi:hypothetical protein